MSNEHAMRFPLVGSAMLLSLFLLFKFLSKDLVNAVLTCYFFILGIFALSYVLSVTICFFISFLIFLYHIVLLTLIPKLVAGISFASCLLLFELFLLCSATLLPAIKRFLPEKWNEDLIIWRFPYFPCMCAPYYSCNFTYALDSY